MTTEAAKNNQTDKRVHLGEVWVIVGERGLFGWGDYASLVFASKRAAETFADERIIPDRRDNFRVECMKLGH